MDSKTYLKESARTASTQFHTEIVTPPMLRHALESAVNTGELVDIAKKSLFYGKAIKDTGHGKLLQNAAESDQLDVEAVPHDILHAAMGIYTEAAEMLEAVLKAMESGDLDKVNLLEEIGDTEWYAAMMYRAIEKTPGEAKEVNINKLRKRFPEKFETSFAIDRDLSAEREILEKGSLKNEE